MSFLVGMLLANGLGLGQLAVALTDGRSCMGDRIAQNEEFGVYWFGIGWQCTLMLAISALKKGYRFTVTFGFLSPSTFMISCDHGHDMAPTTFYIRHRLFLG